MPLPTVHCRTLIEAETSLVFGTDLFIGREPKSPDDVVTLFDTPSGGSQTTTEKNEGKISSRYEYVAVQARIRNSSYEAGMQQAEEIVNVLHNRGNETIGGEKVGLIQALDNPTLLDWDDNNRARIVVNFELQQIVTTS